MCEGIARRSPASPADLWDGSRHPRARLEERAVARFHQAVSCQCLTMDSLRAEADALEAEIKALRRACVELPAPGEDTSPVRYVAFLRLGGKDENLSTPGSRTSVGHRLSRAPDVGWNSLSTKLRVRSPRVGRIVNAYRVLTHLIAVRGKVFFFQFSFSC